MMTKIYGITWPQWDHRKSLFCISVIMWQHWQRCLQSIYCAVCSTWHSNIRTDSRLAPSQWETSLLEKCCYKVTLSLVGWVQTSNQPWTCLLFFSDNLCNSCLITKQAVSPYRWSVMPKWLSWNIILMIHTCHWLKFPGIVQVQNIHIKPSYRINRV